MISGYLDKHFTKDVITGKISEEEAEEKIKALASVVSGAVTIQTKGEVSDKDLSIAQNMADSVITNNELVGWRAKVKFAKGMYDGVKGKISEDIEGLYDMISSPKQTLNTIKALINDPKLREKLINGQLNDIISKYNNVYDALISDKLYEGENARKAGDDAARLLLDIISIATGAGAVKVAGTTAAKALKSAIIAVKDSKKISRLEVNYLEKFGKKSHNKELHERINDRDRQAILRTDYEREVSVVLKKEIDAMKKSGKYTEEEIARYGNKRRLEIGEKYKDLTPKELQETVFKDNLVLYENKWGPSYEFLKRKGCNKGPCTDAQIIEKVTRPGGERYKKNGVFDKPELKWRKYKDE